MEEVSEGLLRWVFKVFRWLIVDAIVEGLCFQLGRFSLLLITLGKYPRGEVKDQHEGRITLLGVCILILILLAIGLVNSATYQTT